MTLGFVQMFQKLGEGASSTTVTPAWVTACGAAPKHFSFDEEMFGADTPAGPETSDLRAEHALASAGDDGSGVKSSKLTCALLQTYAEGDMRHRAGDGRGAPMCRGR